MRNLPSETLWIPLWTLRVIFDIVEHSGKGNGDLESHPFVFVCLWIQWFFSGPQKSPFFVTEHFPKCVMNQTLIDPCSLNKSECQLTLIVIPLIEYLTFTFKLSPYTWDSHICCSRICKVLSLSSIRTMYYFFNLLKFLRLLSVLVWKCNYVKGYTYEIY